MCLSVPAQIVQLTGNDLALANMMGVEREICLRLSPNAREGDYVLVHAGFALHVIDAAQARETLAVIDGLGSDATRHEEES